MEIQEIQVVIEKDGQVSLAVRGVTGQKCLALTHELENALGGQILSRQMTAEATASHEQTAAQSQRLQN